MMKNKLVVRILGALASALIVVSVFTPFISVTGYSSSIWEINAKTSIYLPIMIVLFGAIGILFFALNKKTEFAYMAVGANTFYLVMQTVDIVYQGSFNTLGAGYYFLAIGTLLTGVMTFLNNLKSKTDEKVENKEEKSEMESKETSVVDQINNLYNSDTEKEITPVMPINNLVEPIPVEPINTVMQDLTPQVEAVNPVVQELTPQVEAVNPVVQELTPQVEAVNPVVQELTPQVEVVNPVMQELTPQVEVVNPVVQDLAPQVEAVNPVMQELTPQVEVVNPVVQELTPQVEAVNPVVQDLAPQPASVNPVVQDLSTPSVNGVNQPLPSTDQLFNQSNNMFSNREENVDIFGQPINR